jgi:hypothetical protein
MVATIATGIIAVGWGLSLPTQLAVVQTPVGATTSTTPVAEQANPITDVFSRARTQLGAAWSSIVDAQAEISSSSRPTSTPPRAESLVLTPEDIAAAQASASIPYLPPATTTTVTPRVVRIATTSASVGNATAATMSATTSGQ